MDATREKARSRERRRHAACQWGAARRTHKGVHDLTPHPTQPFHTHHCLRASMAAPGRGAAGPATPSNYKTVVLHGAKIYIPIEGDEEGAGGARRNAALTWINSLDTRIRFWVSGVVREE